MTAHAVVAPHYLSAEAGRTLLEAGGNAVDAAIAAIAVQGVVAPETCGVGGDLFALIHEPGWETPKALNASGRAGSGADAETLRRSGMTEIPRDHPMTVTIPGCIDGLVALADGFGSRNLAECLQPAIEHASRGFEVSNEQARAFASQSHLYSDNPAVSDFYATGAAVEAGDLVRRPALAATLTAVADGGRDAFYLGQPGQDIVRALDGVILERDLEANNAEWVTPLGCEVAGLTAWTAPPNSQGYLGPAALAVFEMLEPPSDMDSPDWWHLLIESYRCLAWERNDLVADPDFAPLPPDLLVGRDRLTRAAGSIDRETAGVWPEAIGRADGTAYLNVVDERGLAVSIIQSNYRGTGSTFGAAKSGFLLQDRGGGFSLMPGHPNEMAPGKRPLHTLAPTLWTNSERTTWLIGTRGGAVQPQLVAQLAARAVLGSSGLEAAQFAPRWTVQEFGPGSAPLLAVEPGAGEPLLEGLRRKGHQIEQFDHRQPGWGPMSIIEVDGDRVEAAADPRVDTTAALVF